MAPASHRNLAVICLSYFFVLLNYSVVRAASTTIFYEAYGAKSSPIGWLVAIAVLMAAVTGFNKLQAKIGFHWTFASLGVLSVAIFLFSYVALTLGVRSGAMIQFAWKEVYIVLQVHLMLAYANSSLGRADFLRWVGPIGAMGGLGGTLGGFLTSYVAKGYGTEWTLYAGLVLILIPALMSLLLDKIPGSLAVEQKDESPLRSLDTPLLRRYVWSIALITAMSQFVINIADFKFGLIFEQSIADSAQRTAYLGDVYTITNALTLVMQLVILPLGLRFISERALHAFIPISYMLCLFFGLGSGAGALLTMSSLFVFMKASDYSLFSSAKELLYHPMKPMQKYGAKYLTDMVAYRAAKASIAVVLLYFQSPMLLNGMMISFMGIWLALVFVTFRHYRQLFS